MAEDAGADDGAAAQAPSDLQRQRRRRAHRCWDHLLAAPLWPMHGANLGTLLWRCDAVAACLAVPRLPWVPTRLERGNTLRHRSCVHWVDQEPAAWLARQRERGSVIVGVELTNESIRLADLAPARQRTMLVLVVCR
jgi:tRNA (guanosine-2'-O-)-methyltransferase